MKDGYMDSNKKDIDDIDFVSQFIEENMMGGQLIEKKGLFIGDLI